MQLLQKIKNDFDEHKNFKNINFEKITNEMCEEVSKVTSFKSINLI